MLAVRRSLLTKARGIVTDRQIITEILGRARLKHDRLIAACDDASERIAHALRNVNREHIAKLARAANVDLKVVEAYITERAVGLLEEA